MDEMITKIRLDIIKKCQIDAAKQNCKDCACTESECIQNIIDCIEFYDD